MRKILLSASLLILAGCASQGCTLEELFGPLLRDEPANVPDRKVPSRFGPLWFGDPGGQAVGGVTSGMRPFLS